MALPQLLQWVNGQLLGLFPTQMGGNTTYAQNVVALNSAGFVDPSMLSLQLEGGDARAKFLASQILDGGNASTVYGVVPYAQVILQDQPVAYWPLNETAGAVANDLSGNGYNAAYIGTPTLGAAPIAPGLGASVSLNGSTQYVELATPPAALQLVEGSFEGWWLPSVIPTAANTGGAVVAAVYNSSNVNYMLGFGANDGSTSHSNFSFGHYGAAWTSATNSTAATANTPAHLVATFNGTTMILYVNGVSVASVAASTFTPTANGIVMGAGDNGGYLTGLLSNVAIYNTVLSAARIQAHYNAGIA